jgi:hypothetical protein
VVPVKPIFLNTEKEKKKMISSVVGGGAVVW